MLSFRKSFEGNDRNLLLKLNIESLEGNDALTDEEPEQMSVANVISSLQQG